jgi:hypothetical protein
MNESPTYIYVEAGDRFLLHPASLAVPEVNLADGNNEIPSQNHSFPTFVQLRSNLFLR